MNEAELDESKEEITNGWPIVSASAVGIGLGMSPLPFYTIGVFVGPISQEFGWPPSKVLSATAAYCIALFIVAPGPTMPCKHRSTGLELQERLSLWLHGQQCRASARKSAAPRLQHRPGRASAKRYSAKAPGAASRSRRTP